MLLGERNWFRAQNATLRKCHSPKTSEQRHVSGMSFNKFIKRQISVRRRSTGALSRYDEFPFESQTYYCPPCEYLFVVMENLKKRSILEVASYENGAIIRLQVISIFEKGKPSCINRTWLMDGWLCWFIHLSRTIKNSGFIILKIC